MCNCDCSENAYGISLTVLVTTYMDFGVVSKTLVVSYMFHTFLILALPVKISVVTPLTIKRIPTGAEWFFVWGAQCLLFHTCFIHVSYPSSFQPFS